MSSSRLQWLALALMITSFGVHGRADDDEQSVALDNVPQSIKDAATKAVSGLRLESATVEAVLVFEIEGESGNTEHEIEVTAEGQVISSEAENEDENPDADDANSGNNDDADRQAAADESEEGNAEHEISIPLSAVPAAALKAAEQSVAGLKAEEAEVESVLIYELVGSADGKRYEIEITAEGDVIETETAD
jgi:hypothetical protein